MQHKHTKRPYKVTENGFGFHFAWDPDDPAQLHITVRHLTDIDDALDAFFERDHSPKGNTLWNEPRKRFETRTETHILFWNWRDPSQTQVRIISCINRKGGSYSTGGGP